MTEGNYVRLLGERACAVTNRCGRQLCETVITFAGERSVSSETDGTIARQKHRFSALSWCAKASRVSRKRAEGPALVLTVSSRCAVSSFCAKKFAQRPLVWTRSPARSQPHTATHSACRSARGHGPGRSPQHMSSDNYRNNFKALGPIMNGARIIDEPRPTLKPAITSVTQWTPRYRRVTQMNTMSVSAAAHSR